jgi:hypothetical protein
MQPISEELQGDSTSGHTTAPRGRCHVEAKDRELGIAMVTVDIWGFNSWDTSQPNTLASPHHPRA